MCQVSGGGNQKTHGLSYASITWIRFYGSSAFRAELSAFVVPQSETAGWLPDSPEPRAVRDNRQAA